MNRRRLAVIGLVVLLAASMIGPIAAQDADPDAGGDSEYTLQDLRQDGKHYAVDGARIVPSEEKVFWLEHTPANQPWRDVTKENNGPKFGAGQTLKTNTLYLRTIRATSDTESVNVTLVSWNMAHRTVEEGNTTKTVPYATNISSTTTQVNLGPGWALGEIKLPRHDQTKRVTMWIEGAEDTARWTFKHQSIAFTQPLDADTYAEFVLLSGLFVIIPAMVTGWFGTRKVRSWIDRAGAPPGHGPGWYTAIAAAATGIVVYGIYAFAAEIIVTAPVVLGVGLGVIFFGYMLATHEGRTQSKLFWQPHIESVSSFASSKIPSIGSDTPEEEIEFSEDMPFGQMRSFRVLDEGRNGLSIVRDGWMAFLARLKGGRARIENANELRTRFSLWNSGWDEVFIVDPDADSIIEYERPGLSLQLPEINSWHDLVRPGFVVAVGAGGAWKLAQIYGEIAWAVMALAVPYLVWKFLVTGTDSYVHINPAPIAMRPVLASMFVLHMGHRDATSLEEAEEFAWKALAGQERSDLTGKRSQAMTIAEEALSSSNDEDGLDDKLEGDEKPTSALDDIDTIDKDVKKFVWDGEVSDADD